MLPLKEYDEDVCERFLTGVRKTGQVWLLDDDGLVADCSADVSHAFVLPFFSASEDARRGAACRDSRYKVSSVSLEVFVNELLPTYVMNGDFIGPDWDSGLANTEVPAQDILEALQDAV